MRLVGPWQLSILAVAALASWWLVLHTRSPDPNDAGYYTVDEAVASPYGLLAWLSDPAHAEGRTVEAIGHEVIWTVQATVERDHANRIFRFGGSTVIVATMRDEAKPPLAGAMGRLTGVISAIAPGRIELSAAAWQSHAE